MLGTFQALHKLSNGSDTRLIKFKLIQSQITKSFTGITKNNLEIQQQNLSADSNKEDRALHSFPSTKDVGAYKAIFLLWPLEHC